MDKLYTIEIGIEEPWIGTDDTFEIQYEFTEDELSEIILGGIRLIHSESMDIGTYEFIEVLSKSAFSTASFFLFLHSDIRSFKALFSVLYFLKVE